MNDRALTKPRAEQLAAFIHSLRPDWDMPGIVVNLAKAKDRGDTYIVAIAAIRAAAAPGNRTPAIIAMDGFHWRPPRDDDPAEPRRTPTPTAVGDMRCPHCGVWVVRNEPHRCAHVANPVEGAARARAALAAARNEGTPE